MHAGLASHCAQNYAGEFELLFGVSSPRTPPSPKCPPPRRLPAHPHPPHRVPRAPRPQRQTLQPHPDAPARAPRAHPRQRLRHPRLAPLPHPHRRGIPRINDRTSASSPPPTSASPARTLWSRLEALGISTDFIPGALVARALEGGLRFGLGSTLATTKSALASIGGFASLTDQLADDYELGARLHRAGYRVELLHEIVATSVPPYTLRGFCDHQLRWARGTRDSRRAGYLGLGITYVLPWAVLTMIACGGELWSFTLFSVALLARIVGRARHRRRPPSRRPGPPRPPAPSAPRRLRPLLLGLELRLRHRRLARRTLPPPSRPPPEVSE